MLWQRPVSPTTPVHTAPSCPQQGRPSPWRQGGTWSAPAWHLLREPHPGTHGLGQSHPGGKQPQEEFSGSTLGPAQQETGQVPTQGSQECGSDSGTPPVCLQQHRESLAVPACSWEVLPVSVGPTSQPRSVSELPHTRRSRATLSGVTQAWIQPLRLRLAVLRAGHSARGPRFTLRGVGAAVAASCCGQDQRDDAQGTQHRADTV